MRLPAVAAASLALLAGLCAAPSAAGEPPALWVYLPTSLATDAGLVKAERTLARARAVGATLMVLGDPSLRRPDQPPRGYADRVRQFADRAADAGIELAPAIAAIGTSTSILAQDPNLDEGVPVRDAQFRARGGEARLVADRELRLANDGFEVGSGNRAAGWTMQDGAGQYSYVDTRVAHSGRASLRLQDVAKRSPQRRLARVAQVIGVRPFRTYLVEAWIRTRDFDTAGRPMVFVADLAGRQLAQVAIPVQRTQEWTRAFAVFNSLQADQVRVYLGLWSAGDGAIWFDDASIREIGLVNVIRRSGCPFQVVGDDGVCYEEGRDWQPVAGMASQRPVWTDPDWDEDPPLRLTPSTRVPEGALLRLRFYTASFSTRERACCLSEPAVFDRIRAEAQYVEEMLHPRTWVLTHTELRSANWCEACQSRHLTPGELLADNVRQCADIVRETHPDADLWFWSDMFDPGHNAKAGLATVNGTFEGSWAGLPPDAGVLNWNPTDPMASVRWFAGLGLRQAIVGYGDKGDAAEAGDRLGVGLHAGVPDLVASLYTSWLERYDNLEAWATSVRDHARAGPAN